VRKVSYIEQFHETECGLCCISMILKYYKSHETLNDLRAINEPGRDGLTLFQVSEIFKSKGFISKAFKISTEDPLQALLQVRLPCILFWDNNHYVVLEKIKGNTLSIVNPAVGSMKFSLEEFKEHFSSICIEVTPTEKFTPVKNNYATGKYILKNMVENKKILVLITVLSLLIGLFSIEIPLKLQEIINKVVYQDNFSLSYLLLFFLMLLVYFIIKYVQENLIINAKVKIDGANFKELILHLLKLPYKFFESRNSSDLLFRIGSVHSISDLITSKVINLVVNVVVLLVILVYMLLSYKSLIFACLVVTVCYCLFVALMTPYLQEKLIYSVIEQSNLQLKNLDIIQGIYNIKTSALETHISKDWEEQLAKTLKRQKSYAVFTNVYSIVVQGIIFIAPIFTLIISLKFFSAIEMNVGALFGIYALSQIYFQTLSSLLENLKDTLVNLKSVERVIDILYYKKEEEGDKAFPTDYKGNLSLENVSFAYSKDSEPVLKDISLTVKAGEKIAFVGKSGSGKSTLAKLILGLYQPDQGHIFFDGIEETTLKKEEFRKHIASVPQDIFLFNSSIYDNITNGLKLTTSELENILLASNLLEVVDEMPMGLFTPISNTGNNISGGQKQRISIARVIAKKPHLLVLDEATSSLDTQNQTLISQNLMDQHCTLLVIAHRLNTIKDADKIYVLKEGRIVEAGTHEQLLSLKQEYYNLYNNEL
jgi:ABC-type bacteriocin/lantibiotic exporter with double-glycine peptidase domain